MKKIYKYPVKTGLEIPRSAQVVKTEMQDGNIFIWAIVDPAEKTIVRDFSFYGTGHELPPHASYIGTVFEGPFVWHVMETTK